MARATTHPVAVEAEQSLQKQQLEMIFNSARDMMLLARVEPGKMMRIVSVNRPYVATIRAAGFGLEAADFEGRSFAEVAKRFGFDAATVAQIRARYEQVIATRQALEFEEVTRTPAGVFYGRSTITPILNGAGACEFVLYSSQDVTALKRAEEARLESERTLRAILDHSFELIGLLDPAGRLLRSNEAALRMAGVRSEDVLGRFFWDTPWWQHAPEEQARLKEAVQRAAQGEFVRFETTHPAADGSLRFIDFSLKPVRNEQGTVTALVPEGRDITERKQAEQALKTSEEKFAKAFRATPDAVAITDLETGRFIETNGSYERIFGVEGETLIGRTTVEMGFYQDPADRQRIVDEIRAGRAVRNVELRCFTQRREPITVLYSGEAIEMGGRKCLVSVIHDITDRLRSEQARCESEEKFASAFRLSPNAMSIARLEDGRYLDINDGHQEMFGYPPSEIIGRTPPEIGMLVDPGVTIAALAQLRATGRVQDLQLDVRTRSGAVRTIVNCAELIHVGGRECALLTSQDITERLRAERALHESEEKFAKAFLACPNAMSVHELESGRYVDVNEGFLRLFGGTREDIIGRTTRELGFWSDPAGREGFVDKLRREGRVRNFRVKVRLRDGRIRTCELSAEKIEIGGRPHNVTVLDDITENLEAELALRASEDKFARAFRASPDAITISDFESGRMLEVNEGFERLSGYPRAELVGHTAEELGLWAEPAGRASLMAEVQRTGAVRNLQMRVKNRHGQEGTFLISAETVEIVGRKCLVVVSRDISDRLLAERAVRESEEKFAKAFQVSPDIMAITEFETGRYVEVNEAHERLFGFTREESLGRSPLELGILTDPGVRAEMMQLLEREGRVKDFRVEARNRRGDPVILLLSAERIRVGGRDCVLRCSHDITEQVRAVQALRESEEKFAKAFRASPDAISISELATGQFLDVNEGFERLSGFKRDELIGRRAVELGIWVSPDDRVRMLEDLGRTGSMRNRHVRARSRDGAIRDYLMSAETVEIGGKACLVLLSHDISERLVAEQALRASEEKFARAFRASPYSLTISEMATGRYVDVNGGFEQLSGYTREEVIGRTSIELNLWVDPAERDMLIRRLQEKNSVRGLEISFRAKDGRIVTALCNCEPIEVAGVPCLLNVLEDTTERRKSEEQKAALEAQLRQNQKLEALGTLAGGIAHDFNNILTAIIVNQELAVMDLDHPTDLRRRLAEIGQASGRAKELVRQILTFSRQQPHERLRQHLQMIVREALGLLRASLPATIEISQELSPDAPPVLADASQIHQVVMNLCTNASHAMRDRPGRLTVNLMPRVLDAAACLALPGLRPGHYAWLTVTDTGHGMDAAVLARIFEPFFTTKGPGEGTGLGLPMVHGIVRDHEGAIFVHSSPGRGTTFEIYFPEATEPGSQSPVVETDIAPGRGETVLVVDDEEAICEAIGAMLTRIGYRVQTFTDPRRALERFRAGPSEFSLLLTDRTMPHLSGPELIAQVRDWWPSLPVLLMSGLNGAEGRSGEARDGGYRLVAKPIDIADLSRAVRRVLDPTFTP